MDKPNTPPPEGSADSHWQQAAWQAQWELWKDILLLIETADQKTSQDGDNQAGEGAPSAKIIYLAGEKDEPSP